MIGMNQIFDHSIGAIGLVSVLHASMVGLSVILVIKYIIIL